VNATEPHPGQGEHFGEDARPEMSHGEASHGTFAHYVDKSKIHESMQTGTPVTALCGKVWVPTRDPKRFPVCPTCKAIYEMLTSG
jgi:Protein of unknown function (DUF3039)